MVFGYAFCSNISNLSNISVSYEKQAIGCNCEYFHCFSPFAYPSDYPFFNALLEKDIILQVVIGDKELSKNFSFFSKNFGSAPVHPLNDACTIFLDKEWISNWHKNKLEQDVTAKTNAKYRPFFRFSLIQNLDKFGIKKSVKIDLYQYITEIQNLLLKLTSNFERHQALHHPQFCRPPPASPSFFWSGMYRDCLSHQRGAWLKL